LKSLLGSLTSQVPGTYQATELPGYPRTRDPSKDNHSATFPPTESRRLLLMARRFWCSWG